MYSYMCTSEYQESLKELICASDGRTQEQLRGRKRQSPFADAKRQATNAATYTYIHMHICRRLNIQV